MSNKKLTLDDIFNDDEFGLLDSKIKSSHIKTEDDRLIESFEDINVFIDKNKREPNTSSMSEYSLSAKLKNIRNNDQHKEILKSFDRHHLLGNLEIQHQSLDEILEDDELDLLDTGSDLSLFQYRHISKTDDRAESDFIAKRKPFKEKDFTKYEEMFNKVHSELKSGIRKTMPFNKAEKNLEAGNFYVLDGLLVYLESTNLSIEEKQLKSGSRVRADGRTMTVFENGTYSNMLFRSLGKQILKNGKIISKPIGEASGTLFSDHVLSSEDEETGLIYVLQSKSEDPKISNLKDLYKIGFSSKPVDERIKNAANEATYLYADVRKIATYRCYNRNADKLESLIHRFFASACLDIDLIENNSKRVSPREWFVVPLDVIEEAITLILNETITNYEYDTNSKKIIFKGVSET